MALPEFSSTPLIPQEQGFPFSPHLRDPGMGDFTPNAGGAALPHFASFASLVNYVSRVYRYTTDEALRHCIGNALAMRNEPVIMQALRTRQMPVCQLSWHIEPEDPNNTVEIEAAGFVQTNCKRTAYLQQMFRCLLEADFYGKYGVQLAQRWNFATGRRRMLAENWWPINGDKMVFKFDGRVGVLVHGTYQGLTERTDRGNAHFFTQAEREGVIVHKFEPEDADFFDSDYAGQLNGTGIRGRIYWLWWMRSQVIGWMMDYLQRVGGGGFILLYYEHGNDASYQEVKAAYQNKLGHNVILFPRYRDNTTGGPGMQIVPPDISGQQLMISLINEYFDAVIRRYILGTNGTADQGPSGVGEGWADLHAGEFARIVKYDATDLQETLTQDWVKVQYKYCCPGVPAGRWQFDIDKPNVDEYLEGVKTFYELGGSIDAEEVRDVLGLSVPNPDHQILQQVQPQAPVTANPGQPGSPMGVPTQGDSGPSEGGDQAEVTAMVPGQAQMARKGRQYVKALARKIGREKIVPSRVAEKWVREALGKILAK